MEGTMIGYLTERHGIVEERIGGTVIRRNDGSIALERVHGKLRAHPLQEEIIDFRLLYGKKEQLGRYEPSNGSPNI